MVAGTNREFNHKPAGPSYHFLLGLVLPSECPGPHEWNTQGSTHNIWTAQRAPKKDNLSHSTVS